MPTIGRILGLEPFELPDSATGCARMQTLKMPLWRAFLRLSAELHYIGEIQAIDATGMDRIAVSQHYAKRTNYTFRAVKTTPLIDRKTGAILDIHCSMKQSHDIKVAGHVLTRNLDKLTILTADKGCDWVLLRDKLLSEGGKPVIKYREFDWHGVANNVSLDDMIYHQRSNIEATFFALRQKTARSFEREPGLASSANSCSSAPSETRTSARHLYRRNLGV
jgi:IS5 family transposase